MRCDATSIFDGIFYVFYTQVAAQDNIIEEVRGDQGRGGERSEGNGATSTTAAADGDFSGAYVGAENQDTGDTLTAKVN